jgi:8-oxo-dGTP diphosphatase
MDDVKAVDWLPLDAAVERLSRGYERAFLANVGPLALEAAAPRARRPRTRQPVLEQRRGRQAVLPEPPIPVSVSQHSDLTSPATGQDERPYVSNDEVQTTPAKAGRAGVVQKVRDWLRRANLTRSNGSDRRHP